MRVMLSIELLDLVEVVANAEGYNHEPVFSSGVHPNDQIEETQLDHETKLEHVRQVKHVNIPVSGR